MKFTITCRVCKNQIATLYLDSEGPKLSESKEYSPLRWVNPYDELQSEAYDSEPICKNCWEKVKKNYYTIGGIYLNGK